MNGPRQYLQTAAPPARVGMAGARAAFVASGAIALASCAWLAVLVAWTLAGTPVIGMFSDSVWYLALADYYRSLPFGTPPEHALQAYDSSRFPPLYALAIALSGGGIEHQRAVHYLTVALTIGAVAAVVWWSRESTRSTALALAAVPVTILTPALLYWLMVPLSEPLFLIVLLAALVAARRVREGRMDLGVLAAIVAVLPLVRSAGIALIVAFLMWLVVGTDGSARRRIIAALIAIVPAGLWSVYRAHKPVHLDYGGEVSLSRMIEAGGSLAGFFRGQALALADAVQAWLGLDGWSPASLGVLALTAAAAWGWWLRLRARELDAYFVPIYLGMLLAWPYPLEMGRLVGVIMPIAALWSIVGASRWWARPAPPGAPVAPGAVLAVALLAGALAAPAWVALAARAAQAVPPELEPYKRVPAYFLAPGPESAAAGLETSFRILALIDDAASIIEPESCAYTTQTALVMAASRGRIRTRTTPALDPTRPTAPQLQQCAYVIVMRLGSRQRHAEALYPLTAAAAIGEPVLVSRQRAGDQEVIVAALIRLNRGDAVAAAGAAPVR